MLCSRCKKRMAVVFMTRMEGEKTVNEGLCILCAKELGIKPVEDMMNQMGLSDEELEGMENQLAELTNGGENFPDFTAGGAQTSPFLQNLFGNAGGEEIERPEKKSEKTAEKGGRAKQKKTGQKERKFLDNYCENLTQKAAEGKIDNIIGREKEIYRVIQILNRRTKNNPCLIGEPGVGKTAIAEGIAQMIVKKEVPFKLADKEIYLLDLTALVAGTQFRGQFESRIKGLVQEVKSEGNIILFIDEIHNLVGTGDSEGSMSAANILKPALSRGEVQVIGATTFNEYRKNIEKDSALERRFQPVTVEEPSIADTIGVLGGIKKYYEAYHRVRFSDAMVTQAVNLSERYITDRFLPDKAIDMVDEACSCAALRNKALAQYDRDNQELLRVTQELEELEAQTSQPDYERIAALKVDQSRLNEAIRQIQDEALGVEVTYDDLARVVELWTGIPAAKVKESEFKKVRDLADTLKKRIVGQDEAVELVAAAIRRSRVQISPRRRPASFIFVGPTGVGKTELVKVLAQELFDQTDPLIRLDMSEFMEKHSVSRIIGSPPGYVGYDEAGQLTEKIRRKPYSVVLFDEIEKAHADVMNILLQILDEGKVTDAHGRVVNFQNTVVVMTSNAGSEKKEVSMGFARSAADISREKALKALSEFLRPEFISRVDEVVVFNPLTEEDYQKIAALLLGELTEPLAEKGIAFSHTPEAAACIAREGFSQKHGARDLRRVIRKRVEDQISLLLIDRYENPPAGISLTVSDGSDGASALVVQSL